MGALAVQDTDPLMSLEDVKAYLGVGTTLAGDLLRSGEVPTVRIGKLVRVRRSALDEWIASRTLPATRGRRAG